MSKVVELVNDLVTTIIDDTPFELVDVEFVKEGKTWFLRVFLDKEGGIDIDDCAMVSESLSQRLDELDPDPIPQAYFLEVSSPGAERPLKTEEELKQAIGSYIHISFYQAQDGVKFLEGFLDEVDSESIVLTVKNKTQRKQVRINRTTIAKARLAIEF